MNLFSAYWHTLSRQRRLAFLGAGLAILAGGLEAAAIASLVPLLDADGSYEILGTRLEGSGLRWAAVAGFGAAGILAAASKFGSEAVIVRFTGRLEETLRTDLTERLLRMRWTDYLSMRLGDINTSTLLTVARVTHGSQVFLRAVAMTGVTLVLLSVATVLAPRLSLFTVAFGIVAGLAYAATSRRAERQTSLLAQAAERIGGEVADIFGNLKLFRSTGNVSRSMERINATYHEFADAYYQSQVVTPTVRTAFEGATMVFVAGVLALSLAIDGEFTPGALAFLAVFFRLAPRLIQAQEHLQLSRVERPWLQALQRQLDAADAAREPDRLGTGTPVFERSVRFDDVRFEFPQAPVAALSGVSWELARGECVAFVGESGSGKTTMLDLLSGLLDPTSGTIRVDGVDLREMDLEAWQSHLGVVMQDSPLFHATVLDNVRWTSDEVDEDRAWHCLAMANAKEFVEKLPDQLHTVIGERGGKLSGGQRQRLALARALYREPWILLLDEATSALDSESEEVVKDALEQIKGTCTIVMVAHRLKTVEIADRILVLEEGRVVQTGSWAELAADTGGSFARMTSRQHIQGRAGS